MIPIPHAVISWVSVGVIVGPPGPLPPFYCTAGSAPVTTPALPAEAPPTVTLTIVDGTAPPVSADDGTRWEGERLIATRPLQPTGNTVRVIVESDQPIRVSRVFLAGLPKPAWGAPAVSLPTFGDRCDSDGDGISDATEPRSGTIWLEAEHYAPDARLTPLLPADDPLAVNPQASGGRVLPMRYGSPGFLLGDANWGYVPGQVYSVFVRGALLPAAYDSCYPSIDVLAGPPGNELQASIGFSDQLEWHHAGTFVAEEPFTLSIREGFCEEATWVIDRVALVPQPATARLRQRRDPRRGRGGGAVRRRL